MLDVKASVIEGCVGIVCIFFGEIAIFVVRSMWLISDRQ